MIPRESLDWFDLGEVILGIGLAAAGFAVARGRRLLQRARTGDETRFLNLVESAPFGVVVHDRGQVIWMSERGRALLGIQGDAPPDEARFGDLMAPCGAGQGGASRELDLEDAAGRPLQVNALTIESTFGSRPACLTFFRDITAEVAARRELAENRERLAVALEAARDGVWDLDLRSGALATSPAFASIAGFGGSGPADAGAWLSLVHPGDRERLQAARAAQDDPGSAGYACEVRLVRPDGGFTWVLEHGRVVNRAADGRPLRLAGTIRDITARRSAELRLEVRGRMAATFLQARGEELSARLGLLLQEVLEAPGYCIGTYDAGRKLRLACNCGGGHRLEVLAPGEVPPALRRVLEASGPLVIDDTRDSLFLSGIPRSPLLGVRLASGDRVLGLVAVAGRPGGYRRGDEATMAGIAADLAPLVQSRLEAEANDAQLAQSQKMQALGVMAGGIAHDFNNILQAILGFSTLARQDAHDPARLAADLDRVERATVRGRDLVQRILHFSRPGDPEAPPLDPLPLLEEIALELRTSQPRRVRVETSFAADCGHVRTGPEHLKQALVNLAHNAAQAMGAAGGTLTLAARPWRIPPADARFPADWHGREVVEFTVRDTGPGVPEAIRARLFDPFFTTRAVGQGTGLGLSEVHGLVTGLGGRVLLECPAEGGTVASVVLPRVDARGQAAAPVAASAPEAAPIAVRGRVLFVDDDAEIRDLAAALLSRAGFEVETAPDGLAACERLGADAAGIDVVVTDQYMPGLTGRELAVRIANVRPDLPVILVSGLDEPADTAVAAGLVFREVVTKPFFGQSLILAVRRALDVDAGDAATRRGA